MKTAIYPGSFDPITNGHLDVIQRAVNLADRLIIAVAKNNAKSALFEAQERLELIRKVVGQLANVEVTTFQGLLVNFAQKCGASAIVRGLRAVTDFEYEFQMALMNRKLQPAVETIFLTSREEYTYVSSRVIKEVASLGGDISGLVPPAVAEALRRKLRAKT